MHDAPDTAYFMKRARLVLDGLPPCPNRSGNSSTDIVILEVEEFATPEQLAAVGFDGSNGTLSGLVSMAGRCPQQSIW